MKKFVILTMILLSACNIRGFSGALRHGPQPGEAPPETVQGWKEGCETGLSVYGNNMYKSFYSFNQDKRLVNNIRYYTAWKDGMDYCRHWINEYLREGYLGQQYSDDLRDERTATKYKGGLTPDFMGW